jgi:hypothetical protein
MILNHIKRIEVVPNSNQRILVIECPFCGTTSKIQVSMIDYENYLDGGYIQQCFGYLSADIREQIQSGICPKCWDDTFGDE